MQMCDQSEKLKDEMEIRRGNRTVLKLVREVRAPRGPPVSSPLTTWPSSSTPASSDNKVPPRGQRDAWKWK